MAGGAEAAVTGWGARGGMEKGFQPLPPCPPHHTLHRRRPPGNGSKDLGLTFHRKEEKGILASELSPS